MSRMSLAMAAAVVVMTVMVILLIAGPWNPRLVERDAAGVPAAGGPPRPLAPGTPITSVPPPPIEGRAKSP
jgi:hypothetical protein